MTPVELVPMRPRSGYVSALGREMHYVEWGRADARPVILWHGLARTGRDFDVIASALSDRYRLIAPDFRGFGESDNPYAGPSSAVNADTPIAHVERLVELVRQ